MDNDQIIAEAERIIREAYNAIETIGPLAQARELIRVTAGEKSSFHHALAQIDQSWSVSFARTRIESALRAYIAFVKTGMLGRITLQRQAEIDVVSDILAQAQQLLDTKGTHPAAAAVLIGAALEEFLRSWLQESSLSIGNKRPSIDTYSTALREADLITKQDVKDITSWAGVRNHAAHGEWNEVSDSSRVRLVLEGVNLFMRKYA